MKMCSLTVHDESHSCTLLLPDTVWPASTPLIEGKSVLVLRNACALLDSQDRLFLTMASPKYSSIQIYNKTGTSASQLDHNITDTTDDDCVIADFCEDKTEHEIVEILMRNISTIPLRNQF